MRLRHLGWAGVEIDHDGHSLLIDAIKDGSTIFSDEIFVKPLRPGGTAAALVTHLHSDHADPVAIAAALAGGAPVFRPEPTPGSGGDLKWTERAETEFREVGLDPEILQPWEARTVGPFRIIAAPSVDGLGDPQRCWIVECEGTRILHAGDTMFHGYWWAIARAAGPIDIAFLPINGVVLELPQLQPPSPLPAAMLPEEAAIAAHILQARMCVPIHYGVQHQPIYTEAPRAAERFSENAGALGVISLIAARGEWFSPK
ncbi:MAG: MBL fold metallo-hydrolase [Gemmatimonadaceae bacterium]|nr:MBL fold metallo-hydrolase [Acetobacteraceae bacterium]